MEKSRVIKPIAFNTVKDADLLEWIKTVEKTEKLNYASYVRQLINQDMIRKKNGNNVTISSPNITIPDGIGYDQLAEQIKTAVEQLVKTNMGSTVIPKQKTISTMESNINIQSAEINKSDTTSSLDEDDISNLNDLLNGNF